MFKNIKFFKIKNRYITIFPSIIYYNHVKNYSYASTTASTTRWDLAFVWLKWEIGFGKEHRKAVPVVADTTVGELRFPH